ncbi:hypothetical protein [Williamsia sp. 1135]|uniref:hypothetical protein n=1 Tax=Williamsia sp. 1135 TaxID=1889262 RepID=UPI00117CA49F|nr:hypothetical protein [Williamsia sp. 1135]
MPICHDVTTALFKQDDPETAALKAAAKAQRNADRQAALVKEQQRQKDEAFNASPQGLARSARARGDFLFQISLDITDITGTIATLAAPVSPAGAYSNRQDYSPTDSLNAIHEEGWHLHSFSTTFVQTAEVSRDKFLSSGQQTAISGKIVGTYVFDRVARRA